MSALPDDVRFINQRAMHWVIAGETGLSSLTIWSVMAGTAPPRWGVSTPSDPDDFSRCHKLLQLIPEWRERLPEVGEKYPQWKPLVEHWDELTALYVAGDWKPMFDRMQVLIADGLELDGFTVNRREDGSYYSARKESTS